jgi:hypothetical protein
MCAHRGASARRERLGDEFYGLSDCVAVSHIPVSKDDMFGGWFVQGTLHAARILANADHTWVAVSQSLVHQDGMLGGWFVQGTLPAGRILANSNHTWVAVSQISVK